ncbi:hypothetical protein Scep_008065 [Stephania cephalantha]|uniref:Uncharacterized protein n=1 Tax=Stephania cephalantha TaxID=152367 RepID=A0AAP0KAZ4_9MAGN
MASWDPPDGAGDAVEGGADIVVGICVVEVGLVDDDGEIMSRPRSDDRAPKTMGPVRPSRSDPLFPDAARPLPIGLDLSIVLYLALRVCVLHHLLSEVDRQGHRLSGSCPEVSCNAC